MNKRVMKRNVARTALAGLVTVSVSLAGLTVVTSGTAMAATSGTCMDYTSTRPSSTEGGTFTVDTSKIATNNTITVSGTGFAKRTKVGDTDPFIAFKINDGAIAFPSDGQPEGVDVQEGGAYYDTTMEDGTFTVTLKLPDDLVDGKYGLRALLGADGATTTSSSNTYTNLVEFYVNKTQNDGGCGVADPSIALNGEPSASQGDNGAEVAVPVKLSGFEANAPVTAKLDDTDLEFKSGRGTAPSITVDANGEASTTVYLPEGKTIAGSQYIIAFTSDTTTRKLTVTAPAGAEFEKTSLNSTTNATVFNLPDGATVDKVTVGDTNFLAAPVTAKDDVAALNDIALKGSDDLVGKDIVVTYTIDGTQYTTTAGTITPDETPLNEGQFTIGGMKIANGQYQAAINPNTGMLFTTAAVGRPPVKESTLTKIDTATMTKVKEITPAPAAKGVYAVYGIGLDNVNNTIWVSNTRQNTIAVYSQDDLSLIKQMPDDAVPHGRDVVVDEKNGLVYISSAVRGNGASAGNIYVYDAKTYEQKKVINLADTDPNFTVPMALTFDADTGELFTVSLNGDLAAKIDTHDNDKVTLYSLGGAAASASGVAWDPKERNLFIVSQDSANMLVLDVDNNKVIKNINTGDGALNAIFDPTYRLVYSINRTSGNTTVVSADSLEIVAQLESGKNANQGTVGPDGTVYLVNKDNSADADATEPKNLITYKPNWEVNNTPETPGDNDGSSNGSSNNGSSADNQWWSIPLAVLGGTGLLAIILGAIVKFAPSLPALPAPLQAIVDQIRG